MSRDPKLAAIRKAEAAKSSVARCESMLDEARKGSRRAQAEAVKVGVTKSELARIFGTSESRVRQDILRSAAES